MKIQGKITAMGVALVLLTATAIVGITRFQEKRIGNRISEIIQDQARQEAGKVARNVHLMCEVMRESVLETVSHNLLVAEELLQQKGGLRIGSEPVTWQAVNQFTQEAVSVTLPKMLIGNQWLGQNESAEQPTPLVDQVKSLVGGTATVFQRMNEQGDMLRVATNVLQEDGTRAIGTFIPHTLPDGTTNEVIAAVLRGETYFGRAYVVNTWYITAYQPLWDQQRQRVVGVLYFGEKQENVPSLRQGIRTMAVGQTGEVFVVGGTGAQQGRIQVSRNPALRGESLWEKQDSIDGRKVIQDIIAKGRKLKTESETSIPVAFERFTAPRIGEDDPRPVIAAITYYEPWDWVIVAAFNEEDLIHARQSVASGLIFIVRSVVAVAVVVLLLAVVLGLILARNIREPLKQTTDMILSLQKGRFDKRLNLNRHDEIGEMAGAVDSFADNLQEEIQTAFEKLAQGDFTFQAKGLLSKPLAKANLALNDLVQEIQGIADQVALVSAEQSAGEPVSETSAEPSRAERALKVASALEGEPVTAAEAGEGPPSAADMSASAESISQLIKVIDEIAFQTNLLTLSAAAEAARTGQESRSFAVVAEEVRSLAARSARTAKETAELIEGATGAGSPDKIADQTATALRNIVAGIGKVTDLATEIAVASKSRSGVAESANHQQRADAAASAEAAQNLSRNAQRLRQLLSTFKGYQQDNLAAWTELQARLLSTGVQKKPKGPAEAKKPGEKGKNESSSDLDS